MAEKQTNQERLKEITDSIEQGIQNLFESDKYKQYLNTMSRFHKYSVNNQILIYLQKPDATRVAGFNKWKDSFGRNVKKGEKGIKIIAPTPYKKKIEAEKIDPITNLPVLDKNGKPVMEEKEVTVPMFKPVTVFDVSQTYGKPLPELVSPLTGEVKNYEQFLEALKRSSPVPIGFEKMRADTDGYFSRNDQRIALREGMSEVQTVCAAIHEIAHSMLHNQIDGENYTLNRRTEEIQAESIAYAVSQYYGIETKENSFGYIAAWAKDKELPELRASLETINKTSSALISSIDKHFREITKEREGELNLPTKESMNEYGYTYEGMMPVSKQQALEQFNAGEAVYQLYPDNTEAIVTFIEEIQRFEGMFGVELPREHEKFFHQATGDSFAIYQLRDTEETAELRFRGSLYLRSKDLTIEDKNYEMVYAGDTMYTGTTEEKLDGLFHTFNTNIPDDFHGHSLSVSDIVALKQDGMVTYHYVDSFGFKELPDFKANHPLKNAEMAVEDDFNMIDGVINNGKKEPTKPQKKRSVLDKLHVTDKQPTKPARNKRAEQER